MTLTSRFEAALTFATQAHSGQLRMGKGPRFFTYHICSRSLRPSLSMEAAKTKRLRHSCTAPLKTKAAKRC